MIPNIFQSVEEIMKAAPPVQKIMWQQIRLIAGENAAVQQLYIQSNTAGHYILTYVPGEIYIALDLMVSSSSTGHSATTKTIAFYDENNVANGVYKNMTAIWDVTAAALATGANDFQIFNIYFSRISVISYNYIRFIGFKIKY